jgi:hypothetical protein
VNFTCELCGATFFEGVRVTAIRYGRIFEKLLPLVQGQGPVFCGQTHAVEAFGGAAKMIETSTAR